MGRRIGKRYYIDSDGDLVEVEVFRRKDGDWQDATRSGRHALTYGFGRYRGAWLQATPKEAWERELKGAKGAFTAANDSLSKAAERRERAIAALEALR